MKYYIYATRGGGVYLLSKTEPAQTSGLDMGYIYRPADDKLHEVPIDSALARGYWESGAGVMDVAIKPVPWVDARAG